MKYLLKALALFLNALPKTDWQPIPLCWLYGKYGINSPNLVGHNRAPTVTTGSASNISFDNFDMGGEITDTGGANATERGFAYVVGSGGTPTTADSTSSETGSFSTGTFTLNISGLASATTYSVRAYAINSEGTAYGSTVEVTTSAQSPPTVTLDSPADTSTTTDTTPTLSFTGTDAQSDDIRYNVQIDTVDTFDSGSTIDKTSGTDSGFSGSPDNTDPYTSGQQVNYTVQEADVLSDGVTYYWRVRGLDPSGTNTYGSWSSTRSFTVDNTPTISPNDLSISFIADATIIDPYPNQNYTYNDEASLPTNNTDLTNTMTGSEKDDVSADDNTYFDYQASDFAVKQFKFTHDNSTDEITVTWKGKSTLAASSSTVYLQIYNLPGS